MEFIFYAKHLRFFIFIAVSNQKPQKLNVSNKKNSLSPKLPHKMHSTPPNPQLSTKDFNKTPLIHPHQLEQPHFQLMPPFILKTLIPTFLDRQLTSVAKVALITDATIINHHTNVIFGQGKTHYTHNFLGRTSSVLCTHLLHLWRRPLFSGRHPSRQSPLILLLWKNEKRKRTGV